MVLLVGCNSKKEEDKKDTSSGKFVYYVNNDETMVVKKKYKPNAANKTQLVNEYIKALRTKPKDISLKETIPDTVTIKDFNINEDNQLTINFDANYSQLTGISEILCRAAIVKTLSQINGIEYIEFYVNGNPLTDSNEKPVGYMNADSFILNSDGEINYYQDAKLTLYFANKKGNKLEESHVIVTYDGAISIEEVVIQQLMNGPLKEDKGIKFRTIPKEARLLKVTTKDGVCYVDFSSEFLDKLPDITDEVALYSIVNSLVELPNVNKVQFLINGEKQKSFREGIDMDDFFVRNFEIVEGE